MNYKESIEFIESVSWKGSIPGLERIGELCRRLGNPEKKTRFVHVAGTNGKGSVSAIVSSVLAAAGYKTGLFTSPHLVDYTERFKIDGADISREDFCRAAERVKSAAEGMEDAPTEFELLTAMAFVYFESEECDVAVLECGMGGRLDATNVIPSPLVSVITNIALDHTAILGGTELEIAAEKAGIIKSSPVVLGKTSASVKNYIIDICKKKNVCANLYSDCSIEFVSMTTDGIEFVIDGQSTVLPLCGEYQKINLRTALVTLEVLSTAGLRIDREAVMSGIRNVKWIGRFERISENPEIYFDGAHNPDGALLAASTVTTLFPGKKVVLVTGTMADKDYPSVVSTLSSVVLAVFTVTPDNPRALSADVLAKEYEKHDVAACACGSVREGVKLAAGVARAVPAPILCTGSLYMYSEIVDAVSDIFDKE